MGIGLAQAFAPFLHPTYRTAHHLRVVSSGPVGMQGQQVTQPGTVAHPFFFHRFPPTQELSKLSSAGFYPLLHALASSPS